jgi:hypothetical protein
MYIRFKQRTRAHNARYVFAQKPPLVTLAAQVVESERRDGQPRQRVLKHLATLKMEHEHDPKARQTFWRDANRRLDEMALNDFTRGWLEMEIAKRVSPITQVEKALLFAEEARRQAQEAYWRGRAEERKLRQSAE